MKTAIVQPSPGIGDFLWLVPHIRALVAHLGTPVTLVAKPATLADQTLHGDSAIREVIWLDRNPKDRRGMADGLAGLLRMVKVLRAKGFDAVYLLHHSPRLALMLWLAGIPRRYGYGLGLQRLFLNRHPFLPAADQRLCSIAKAGKWLMLFGIPLPDEAEPRLTIDQALSETVCRRLVPPYLVFGIGASTPFKQWSAERFAGLIEGLLSAGWGSVVLVGGAKEQAMAGEIRNRLPELAARIVTALGWHLAEVVALCGHAGFYVGNDTGALNIAAAAGTKAYGIFGASSPLTHSRRIVGVVPKGGMDTVSGMAAISCADVLSVIEADRGGLTPH